MSLEPLNVDYLRGRKVCATGRLFTLTHAELSKLVVACGGEFIQTPTRSGFILIVGEGGWPSDRQDGSVNQTFDKARRLKAYGYNITIIAEDEFLEELGLQSSAGSIRGPHTIGDLSRILHISPVRIRRWLRTGLIQPISTVHQIPYFDFHQVSFIKCLHELIENGASTSDIQLGLDQVRELLPHGESLESLWANIERDGRVLIRLRDRLIDHTGQRYLDFEASGEGNPTLFAEQVEFGIHDLCDEALALEEDGKIEEAAAVYRRAIELKSDNATLRFDLGNVLFQLRRLDESREEFAVAVSIDSEFAMAWHNLGCVHAEMGEWEEAESALCTALSLVPTYADSHVTLAEVYRKQGRHVEAARHQRAYQQFSHKERLLASRTQLLRVVDDVDELGVS